MKIFHCDHCGQHDKIESICNWAVPAGDDRPLCVSCRITRTIPNLTNPASRPAWYRLEVAKRRLLFTLIELGLPVPNRIDDPERGLDAYPFVLSPTAVAKLRFSRQLGVGKSLLTSDY